IALLQADLIVDQARIDKLQIDKSPILIETQREQEQRFKELEHTLSLITVAETRAEALRQVTQKLIPKNQAAQARRLVGDGGGDPSGAAAVVGLELWQQGQAKLASAIAEQLLKSRSGAKEKDPKAKDTKEKDTKEKDKSVSPASLVALCIVVKR